MYFDIFNFVSAKREKKTKKNVPSIAKQLLLPL